MRVSKRRDCDVSCEQRSATDYQMVGILDSRRLHLPMHICSATEKLDIVTVNEMTKTVYPIEWTVCFDEKSMQMKKQAE